MPTPIRTLYSQQAWDGDGTTTVWNFTFAGGYIERTHVKASRLNKSTGDVVDIPVTAGMFLGPYQLSITPAVPVGWELTIYRDTPKDVPLVDFQDQANQTEVSLDTNAKQAIFAAAEATDNLRVAVDSVSEIVNYAESASASALAAAESAVAAAVAQAAAAGSASAASGSAAAAAASAGQAATSATNSQTYATQSAGYRDEAQAIKDSMASGPVVSWAGLTGIISTIAAKTALALNNVTNFRQVENGTGVGQTGSTNQVKIGWGGSRVKVTVDNTDLGNIATDDVVNSAITGYSYPKAGGRLSGVLDMLPPNGSAAVINLRAPNLATSPHDISIRGIDQNAGEQIRWVMKLGEAISGRFALYRSTNGSSFPEVMSAALDGSLLNLSAARIGLNGAVQYKDAAPSIDGGGSAVFNADQGDTGYVNITSAGAKAIHLINGASGQRISWVIQNHGGGNVGNVLYSNAGLYQTGAFNGAPGAINLIEAIRIGGNWFATITAYG